MLDRFDWFVVITVVAILPFAMRSTIQGSEVQEQNHLERVRYTSKALVIEKSARIEGVSSVESHYLKLELIDGKRITQKVEYLDYLKYDIGDEAYLVLNEDISEIVEFIEDEESVERYVKDSQKQSNYRFIELKSEK